MPRIQPVKPAAAKATPVATTMPPSQQLAQPAPAESKSLAPVVANPPTASPVVAPVELPTKADEPAEVKADDTKQGEAKADQPKHVRRQLADAVGINIQPARVRNLLSDSVINNSVRASMEEAKACTNFGALTEQTVRYAVKNKPDAPDEKKPDSQLAMNLYTALTSSDKSMLASFTVDDNSKKVLQEMIGHNLLRIGDDAVCALSSTANLIVHELAVHGATKLVAEKKKTLHVYHVINDDLEKLPVWPFISGLKCVMDAQVECKQRAVEMANRAEEKEKRPKQKKSDKAAAVVTPTPAVSEPVTLPPAAPTTDEPTGDAKEKRVKAPEDGFKHHSKEILKTVVKEYTTTAGQTTGGDIGDDVRTFISHMVYELLVRYSKLIRGQTMFAGVKTIKAAVITSINDFFLIDSGVAWPELEKYVDSRVHAYIEYSQKPKDPASTAPTTDASTPASPPKSKRGGKKKAVEQQPPVADPTEQPPAQAAPLVVAAA